jgi:hypothetical protein
MNEPEINELARRQILAASERTLLAAGTLGVIPTPLDAVAAAIGIAEIVDIGDLPPELAAKKPPGWEQILGALSFRERVIFVDRNQKESRARFTQAHETGHDIIPWHQRSYELDGESGLFRSTKDLLDAEANLAAAHLIFQGKAFFDQALDFRLSINAPLALAGDHGASLHATIRYYAEHHPDPVAVVITGRIAAADGSLPIWTCVESPSFRRRFGHLGSWFSHARLFGPSHPDQFLGDLAHAALKSLSVTSADIRVRDLGGDDHRFAAEAFFNTRCVFVMLAEKQASLSARRFGLRAS